MSDVRAKVELDRLYAELPAIDCQRKCASSCGPIEMGRIEWERIVKRLGYEPRMPPPNPLVPKTLDCPMLKGGICSVYAIRPMICRLWGLVETMLCPWGCRPERVLTTAEGYDFMARAGALAEPENAAEYEAMRERLRMNPDLVAFSKLLHITPVKVDE